MSQIHRDCTVDDCCVLPGLHAVDAVAVAGAHRQREPSRLPPPLSTCTGLRLVDADPVDRDSTASAMHSRCSWTTLGRSRGHGRPCTESEEAEQVAPLVGASCIGIAAADDGSGAGSGCAIVESKMHGQQRPTPVASVAPCELSCDWSVPDAPRVHRGWRRHSCEQRRPRCEKV